jgi:hypothetical protein
MLLLSELKDHVLGITEFSQMLLHHLLKRRRTTVEDDGLWTRFRQVLADHLLSNEAYSMLPLFLWLHIYREVQLEPLLVVLFKGD